MDDVITYEILLVRKCNDEVAKIITVDGYGIFEEALDDILEMVEKEKFDVTAE
jgi:hypothetical protein